VRVVIDTNILISALFAETSLPAYLVSVWREGEFDLLTSKIHIAEVIRVTRYPKIRARLIPAVAGRLINELRDVAITVKRLPTIAVSPDPHDNYLLAMASAGAADFLITGDKRDLLALRTYGSTKIITVRDFLALHQRLP